MNNPVCTYDFTCPETVGRIVLEKKLRECCKKWTYQLEESEHGYRHFQGRVSLKVKARMSTLIKKFDIKVIHWSPTSKQNSGNDFYVVKEETRVDGPWSDTDEVLYIPRQVREIAKLYPWQQYIVDNHDVWDTRTINIIYDPVGNIGKSILVSYMRAHKLAFKIPFCNDFKDIMRMVCDVPTKRCYIVDMPRAVNKDRLFQMYAALEEIKNGFAYDDRYHYKEKIFDSPNIWVFSNILPEFQYLSQDRWVIWQVRENELVNYSQEIDDLENINNEIFGATL